MTEQKIAVITESNTGIDKYTAIAAANDEAVNDRIVAQTEALIARALALSAG